MLFMNKRLIIFSILSILMLLVTACETVSDEQLNSELQQLSDDELNALVKEGEVEEQKALAGQAVNRNRLVQVGRFRSPANRVQQTAVQVLAQRKPFVAITGMTSAQIKRSTSAQAWSSIRVPRGDFNVLLNEPLRVAAWTFQTELERQLGRSFVSEVIGLPSSYYQKDLLSNDLFYGYVEEITDLSKLNKLNVNSKPAGWNSSEKIAEQTMALSENQIVRLENAMVNAYDVVFREMDNRNLGYLKPHFLRAMLQPTLLVVDVTKYRGSNSALVRFLQRHETEIANILTEKGLPNNALFVYDRIDGALVAVSGIDGKALANSFEMESIGLGDCSLAYMVSSGKKNVGIPRGRGRAQRIIDDPGRMPEVRGVGVRDDAEADAYVCPSMVCDKVNANAKNSLAGKWGPEANEEQFERMLQQNCKPSNEKRGADIQGINRDIITDSCFAGEAKVPENSRNKMLACASEKRQDVAVGGANADSIKGMRGTPMGRDCMLSSGPADSGTWTKRTRGAEGESSTYSNSEGTAGGLVKTEERKFNSAGAYEGGSVNIETMNGDSLVRKDYGADGKVKQKTVKTEGAPINNVVPDEQSKEKPKLPASTEPVASTGGGGSTNVDDSGDPSANVNVVGACIPDAGTCSNTCNPVAAEAARMGECIGSTAEALGMQIGRPARQAADKSQPPGTTIGLINVKDGAGGQKQLGQQNSCATGLKATDQTCSVVRCSNNAANNPGACCGRNLDDLKDAPPQRSCAMVQCTEDQIDPNTGQCSCSDFIAGERAGPQPGGQPVQ